MAVTTTGSDSLFFGGSFGAQVIGLNTTANAVGAEFNLTGGSLFFDSSAVLGNTVDGLVLNALGTGDTRVTASIICGNQGAGLRSNVNADILGVANWWGDRSGPFHATKNAGGLGDVVVDGTSGGGMGNVTLIPFIDTVTAKIDPPIVQTSQPAMLEFQFTGANGTVFMGFGGALTNGAFLDPPFVLSTANGKIAVPQTLFEQEDIGNPVAGFVNGFDEDFDPGMMVPPLEELPTVFRAKVFPDQVGEGTVQLTGPCGLTASVAFTATANIGAPLLPYRAQLILALLLALLGLRRLSSRRSPVGDR